MVEWLSKWPLQTAYNVDCFGTDSTRPGSAIGGVAQRVAQNRSGSVWDLGEVPHLAVVAFLEVEFETSTYK